MQTLGSCVHLKSHLFKITLNPTAVFTNKDPAYAEATKGHFFRTGIQFDS